MKKIILAIVVLIIATIGYVTLTNPEEVVPTNRDNSSEISNTQDRGPRGGIDTNNLDEFEGILTSEGLISDLFEIEKTGVSTLAIQESAEAFIASLDEEAQKNLLFNITDEEWRQWSNVDNGVFTRQGISLAEMTNTQKELAYGLMQEALSTQGYELSRDIMKTDTTIGEEKDDFERYYEELYFFTIMGTPSQTEPWGWQLDGHHLVINFFILGDQVVMTPTFLGGEPIITTSGEHSGNIILQDEQDLGLAFMQLLDSDQQAKATIYYEKTGNNNQTEAFSDNVVLDYQGIQASELTDTQKEGLLGVIGQYVNNMNLNHAAVKMLEVEEHIDNTWFSWVGTSEDDAVFYYRIHSPVILIEFDHQGPVAFQTGDRSPTRNHIHTVIRTPNGNDYGNDLLQQHLDEYHSH